MMRWQWHQLDYMQIICTSLETDNHATTSPVSFFTGRMPCLPPNQQRQSTEGTGCYLFTVSSSGLLSVQRRHRHIPDLMSGVHNSRISD